MAVMDGYTAVRAIRASEQENATIVAMSPIRIAKR